MNQNAYRRDFILKLAGTVTGLCVLPTWAQGAKPAASAQPILVLGDSLSAEYGLARGAGWVALLEKRLSEQKIAVTVVNASVSGDTTSGGRARLGALLAQHKPAVVVLELGANDALRGLPLKSTQENLNWMVQAAQKSGAKVVLVGMQIPPNYGSAYARQFEGIFETVARQNKAALVPFLLKGVADGPNPKALFQTDGFHPRAQAHPQMLDNVWPVLRKLLH